MIKSEHRHLMEISQGISCTSHLLHEILKEQKETNKHLKMMIDQLANVTNNTLHDNGNHQGL